ncbi:hypothetical protein [uncultured Campylobacter sp.]|nr:hypothetical protein [uncultured Campylobacter sp.]
MSISFNMSALILACQTLLGAFVASLFVVKAVLLGIEALKKA